MRDAFRKFAGLITAAVGTPWALLVAAAVILVWLVTGPVFGFSDTWQLFINTGTTIVTFLMVFVIQASQNREARATQLKLDELIRAVRGARNELIDLENAPEETVELHQEAFKEIVETAEQSDPEVLVKVPVRPRRSAKRGARANGNEPTGGDARNQPPGKGEHEGGNEHRGRNEQATRNAQRTGKEARRAATSHSTG